MEGPSHVVTLAGVTLPPDLGLKRRHTRPPARRTAHYLERYDRTTLLYDCVEVTPGRLLVSAPRFLNLLPLFLRGLTVDGQPARAVRRRRWLRTEQIEFDGQTQSEVTVTMAGEPFAITPRPSTRTLFAGRDCLMAVNRNNRLEWLSQWAGYYARAHGTTGVVLFDNGSTDYAPHDAAAALAAPGIEAVTVVSAPFPYGPSDRSGRFDVSPRFFQTSMFNIARRDMFAEAAGVLSVDIDEIVRADRPVYELARKHPLGLASFRGIGVYPAQNRDHAQGYAAHTRIKSDAGPGNTKWCIAPDGFMNRFGWAVHRFGGALFPLTTTSKADFLHFRAVTTNWNSNRLAALPNLAHDDRIAAFTAANFGATA